MSIRDEALLRRSMVDLQASIQGLRQDLHAARGESSPIQGTMLGGGLPRLAGLRSRISSLLSYRAAGYGNLVRNFSSYQTVLRPPWLRPSSSSELQANVARSWDYLRPLLRTSNPSRLIISTSTEFEWNGTMVRNNDAPPSRAFDASAPLTAEEWQDVVVATVKQAQDFPPGILFCTSAAIDTGKVAPDGRRIGENRGIALLTGTADPTPIEFGKTNQSPIDGWTSAYTVQPVGTEKASLISVPDITGRRGGVATTIALALCLDYNKLLFPLKPDLIVVPAAGGDPTIRPDARGAEVILCDAQNNSFFEDTPATPDNTAVWAPTDGPASPLINNVFRSLTSGSYVSNLLRSGVTLLSGITPSAAAQTVTTLQRTDATLVTVSPGRSMVVTKERPIPIVDENQLTGGTARVDAATVNIIDPSGVAVDPTKDIPSADPFFNDVDSGRGPEMIALSTAGNPLAPTPSRPFPVSTFGPLRGRLASYLPVGAVAPTKQAGTSMLPDMPQHFVLDGDGLGPLDAPQKAHLKQCYDAGKSVAVLHPSSANVIATVYAFLRGGLPDASPFSDRVEMTDAWLIQRGADGGFQQTTLGVPLRQSALASNASALGSPLPAAPSTNMVWLRDELPASNIRQAAALMTALHRAEALSRSAEASPPPKRALLGEIDPSDLMSKVPNISDVFSQSHTLDGQSSPSTYTVTSIAVPVSCLDDTNEVWDYYYLGHQAVFSCGEPACSMQWYDFNVWNQWPSTSGALVLVSSPATTEGATSTTSSTSWSLSGSLGFFGETGTGNVGGSYTVGKSTTFSTPDVLTQNKSDSSHTMWTFYLGGTIASTTFQPYMQEIFRVARSVEAALPTCSFKTLAKIVPHDNRDGIWIEHWFNVPVPPAPQ